ncbi:MAG: ISAs1 family transposase [Pleurocapsa sp. MO_226.B13]|nr:ISAs1 family transposase [Pleurocapsa sp. MO_226.B13]
MTFENWYQTEIVQLIRQKQADYVLALKKNHPTLHQEVKNWFEQARASNFEGIKVSHDRRVEKGHHRTEKRCCWAVPLSEFGGLYQQRQWSGLQTIVMMERTRHLRVSARKFRHQMG